MCKILKVSESGYYRWLKNKGKPTKRQLLLVEILKNIDEHPDNANYGYKRVHAALEQKDILVSIGMVYRAMKDGGLLHKKCIPNGITKSNSVTQEKENLIKRNFTAKQPRKKLLKDITEIPCKDGKLYTPAILDCFNGEIVALEMRDNMKKELCIDTLKQLPNGLNGAILHSNRGSQYTSQKFRERLEKLKITQSLSGAGHCFDNIRMESSFCNPEKGKPLTDTHTSYDP